MSISKILVANRGEIARRVMRSATSMGIATVAVYVTGDADAPFIADADESVLLETGYLDGPAILEAALATGAQAIHPGYGFLSENADFAASVIAAGLVWIGPSPGTIATMGDKLAAKHLAASLGLPILASSDDPDDASRVGYPLLVKAAAGGGGKGMRIVSTPEELSEAVASAKREAASGFGDDRVFLERYVARSRHIEFQILGDRFGSIIHLGERECSIQRRHQKLIEESPSPIVDDALRSAMGGAALELARSIGYETTGTVEFLVDDDSREFFFLEVNTRLQVEHPVTEAVTGIDLVREQIRIAAGEPLGYDQDAVSFSGHAIEARLCAEDPAAGFLPATGTLSAFTLPSQPVVRWDSGVEQGSIVSVAFDPLLAKVISHAPSRREAAGTLALALERLHLGGVATNRHFLADVLRTESFLVGDTTTDFIERIRPSLELRLQGDALLRAAATAALWIQEENRTSAQVWADLPSGWRNARLPAERVCLSHGGEQVEITYRSRRDGGFSLGDGAVAYILGRGDGWIDLEIGGRRRRSAVTRAGDHVFVQTAQGTVDLSVVPRFVVPGTEVAAGGLSAPMPGVILEVRGEVGERVEAGTTLIVLEAMKMEHHVKAPTDGVIVELFVTQGQQVENGGSLLVIEPEEEEEVIS